MLQDAAIHVDHIDATIRAVVYADGAKALVSGAKELALLEVLVRIKFVDTPAKALLRFIEPVAGHCIGSRFRYEGCPGIPFGITIGSVHPGA